MCYQVSPPACNATHLHHHVKNIERLSIATGNSGHAEWSHARMQQEHILMHSNVKIQVLTVRGDNFPETPGLEGQEGAVGFEAVEGVPVLFASGL